MSRLESLAGNHFLVMGRAGMDLYPDPPGTPIEEAVRFQAALGGSSANIAASLTRLGARAALLTSVSDDAVGRYTRRQLEHYGIDCRWVSAVGEPWRNTLALAESRIENHQSVIYRNGAADFRMTRADVERVDYTGYSALILTGTVLAAEPSRDAALHAMALARAQGLPLIFDVDYRPYSWASAEEAANTYSTAAALCDIIIGNDVEFGFMAGDYDRGLDKAHDLAHTSAAIVVYKQGERGAITLTANSRVSTGIFSTTALKPTGAGDSFMGGFVSSLATGVPLPQAVLRGSACAAIVVSRVGCAPAMPTTDELDAFLAQQPEPRSSAD